MARARLTAADLAGAQAIDEPPQRQRLSAADLEGATPFETPAEPPPAEPKTGKLEGFLRGVKQGATFGFGDELTGLVESLLTEKSYHQARDEARAADKLAAEEHPILSIAGNVAGSAATALLPMGALGRLTGIAGHAARGAATGIVSGAGASEAEDVPGIVADAAKGGLVGGATGAVLGTAADKLVRGAQPRVDRRLIADVGDKATATSRRKIADVVGRLGGEEGEAAGQRAFAQVAEEHGLDAVTRSPAELAKKATEAKATVGRQMGEVFDGVDGMVGGVPRSQVVRALHKVEQQYRTGGVATEAAADKIAKQIELLRERWGGYPSPHQDPLVPAGVVNQLKTSIQEGAFRGTDVAPRVAIRAEQDAARAVRSVLMKHVEKNAGSDAAANLRDLNEQYSVLATIARAARERERLEPFPKTGLRDIAQKVAGPGLLLYAGHPLGAAALAAAPVAKAGIRVADQALARLYSAAQTGNVTAQLVQQSIEAGVPRGLVSRFASGMASEQPASGQSLE